MKKYPLDRLFRALADPTRLRLINLIAEQEICVCYFVEVIDAPQPKISRHLAYLRRLGIVAVRREGKWMHYRLAMPTDSHAALLWAKEPSSAIGSAPALGGEKSGVRWHRQIHKKRSACIEVLDELGKIQRDDTWGGPSLVYEV